jgi:hypothetical protein
VKGLDGSKVSDRLRPVLIVRRRPLTSSRRRSVAGGKLPGLFAESHENGYAGGAHSDLCFSLRLMWRADGMGEGTLWASSLVRPPPLTELLFAVYGSPMSAWASYN